MKAALLAAALLSGCAQYGYVNRIDPYPTFAQDQGQCAAEASVNFPTFIVNGKVRVGSIYTPGAPSEINERARAQWMQQCMLGKNWRIERV